MHNEDPQLYGCDEASDLTRRGSKRRRLLGHRFAEDNSNPELEWSSTTTPHAPNFFNVTSSSPSRMNESSGLVPPPQSAWDPQPFQSQQADFQTFENDTSYGASAYYYGQNPAETYASPWPPAISQEVYGASSTTYSDSPALQQQQQQQHSPPYQDGVQYLNPHGGSKMLYDVSMTGGYALDNNSVSAAMLATQAPSSVQFGDSSGYTSSLQALASLDHLATQIIQTGSPSQSDRVSRALARQFSSKSAVPQHNEPVQPTQQDIIRKANTAVFITSVLTPSGLTFFQLDRAFLDVFVPLGHRLLKWQGAIYLELKTQTYIWNVMNNSAMPETLFDELFPSDLESEVLQRHPDAPSLSPSEQDFIDRCRARRQYLLAESYTPESKNDLPNKYLWSDFIREFSACINKNLEHILSSSHRQSAMHSVMNRRRAGVDLWSYDRGTADSSHDVRRSVSNGGAHRVEKKSTATGQTIRQAWVKSEEEALIAGLERVGGPHWSQILALYGRGGSISEVLKDRNQVQLKDKARNLKLWYLKMGQEVPVSLRGVTGELRKRGGARARAALEAEDAKERRSSDDAEQEIDPMLGIRHDTVDPGAYDRTRKK
ncbi:hypothetical protein AMS68_004865 [Peltaster fructicola]|uniref:Myb-like domain-containing protein n=1 Tax=Peltaster fructicola TaxID=286661 RepID=A0A6H0XXM4_9PEZI|nr:hypothetical protein AMS68_004865 [Peltaster fructicola]